MAPRTPVRTLATVLFTDIVGSTQLATALEDRRWQELLARHHRIVRRNLKRFSGREIDTAGDGFFARFEQPANGVRCACAIAAEVRELGIEIRAGLHTGEVEVARSGVRGVAVHLGSRIMSVASAGEVMVSSTTRDLIAGSGIQLADHGVHRLKGIDGEWHLFEVTSVDGHPLAPPLDPAEAERRRAAVEPPPLSARRGPRIAAAVGAVAALVAIAAVMLTRSNDAFIPAPDTVVQLDQENGEVIGGVHVGTTPTNLAFGMGSLWVANFDDKTIQQVNVSDRIAGAAQGGVSSTPSGLAIGGGYVWVTNGFSGQVVRVDPRQVNAATTIDVSSGVQGVAYGEDAVWIAAANEGTLLRLDPVTGEIRTVKLPEGAQPQDVAVGEGSVWVTDALGGRVFRVDASSLRALDTIALLGGQPARVTFGDGFVWVTSTDADTLTRIDPATGQATTVSDVGNGPLGVAAAQGVVWVANSLDGTVTRIDSSSARILGRTRIGYSPDGVAITPDGVWVSVHSL